MGVCSPAGCHVEALSLTVHVRYNSKQDGLMTARAPACLPRWSAGKWSAGSSICSYVNSGSAGQGPGRERRERRPGADSRVEGMTDAVC